MRIAREANASDASSRIDLESEIARRSQLRSGLSSVHGGNSVIRTTTQKPLPAQPLVPATPPIPAAGGRRVLWIIGLAIMFILAVLLGVFIAWMTLDRGGPSSAILIPATPLSGASLTSIP